MRTLDSLSPGTKLCGIIGNPVEHSMSPALHNRAFSELELDYVYLAFRVEAGNVAKALDGVRVLENFRGLSVTMPHKVEAAHCVDEISDADKGIGSINTIINDNGVLRGLSSDGPGARQALIDNGLEPTGSRVVLMGTGGASRAIAFDLAFNARPEKLTFMGVVKDELDQLTQDIARKSDAQVEGVLLNDDALKRVVADSNILINATPVGMHPNERQSIVPAEMLHSGLGVMDIVYNPLTTRLLADARGKGLTTVDGLEMFVNQAVIQFESWTGCDAPKDLMREVVLQRLKGKS